jgi:hypothetical protein
MAKDDKKEQPVRYSGDLEALDRQWITTSRDLTFGAFIDEKIDAAIENMDRQYLAAQEYGVRKQRPEWLDEVYGPKVAERHKKEWLATHEKGSNAYEYHKKRDERIKKLNEELGEDPEVMELMELMVETAKP